jgi:hypothetical protein
LELNANPTDLFRCYSKMGKRIIRFGNCFQVVVAIDIGNDYEEEKITKAFVFSICEVTTDKLLFRPNTLKIETLCIHI